VDITTAGGQIINTNDIDVMQRVLADIKDVKNATIVSSAQTALGDKVRANLPEVYGGNTNPTPVADMKVIEQRYQSMFDNLYSDLTQGEIDALMAGFPVFKMLLEKGGEAFYQKLEGKDMALWGEAIKSLQEENKIKNTSGSVAGTGLDFMEMDITRAQLEKYVPRAQNLTKQLEGKGYKSNVEDVLIATSDNQITKQHVDMKILQYLLGQILDTEKKQLQGVWNLPEGASFWVPLQSMIGGKDEGKGGKGKLDPSIFAPDATATEGYDWKSSVKETIKEEFPTFTMKKKDPWELYGERREPATPLTTNMDDYYLRHPGEKPGITAGVSDGTSTIDKLMATLNNVFRSIASAQGGRAGWPGVEPSRAGLSGAGAAAAGSKTLQYEHLLREYAGGSQPGGSMRGGGGDVSPIANKIDIKFSSTTQLTVDGRVLATIIKPYLASDLVNTNQASGGITRAYVI
jgi:hypothetical protein